MTRPYVLSEAARMIAGDTGDSAAVLETLRGWAKRGTIAVAKGPGATSAMYLQLEEIVRAAILVALRRSLGIDVEPLADAIDARRLKRSGLGADVEISFDRLVESVASDETWLFRVILLQDRADGSRPMRVLYAPAAFNALCDADYSNDAFLAEIARLDLNLDEIFRPIRDALNA